MKSWGWLITWVVYRTGDFGDFEGYPLEKVKGDSMNP